MTKGIYLINLFNLNLLKIRIIVILYLINLWFPSMCHNEFGPATLYTLRRIEWHHRMATAASSTRIRLSATRCLWTRCPRLWRCPWTIRCPSVWLPSVISRTRLSSSSLEMLEYLPLMLIPYDLKIYNREYLFILSEYEIYTSLRREKICFAVCLCLCSNQDLVLWLPMQCNLTKVLDFPFVQILSWDCFSILNNQFYQIAIQVFI